jgi:hypothetical protein
MWRIRWAPNNARKWQVGFNSAFKGLITNVQVTCTSTLDSTTQLSASSLRLSRMFHLPTTIPRGPKWEWFTVAGDKMHYFFILPFSPSSHKYDIGHVKLSLHSLHYIKHSFTIYIKKRTCNTFTSTVEHSNIMYN